MGRIIKPQQPERNPDQRRQGCNVERAQLLLQSTAPAAGIAELETISVFGLIP